MKFVKTFFILISLSVLNAVFCFNYTFCSTLIQKTENHPRAKNNLRAENNSGTSKNTEKLTKNYLETSLKRYGIYQYKKIKSCVSLTGFQKMTGFTRYSEKREKFPKKISPFL